MSDSIDNSNQHPGARRSTDSHVDGHVDGHVEGHADHTVAPGAGLPGELHGLVRALDARGERLRAQSELAPEALERIFAASDLQLPLHADPSRDRPSVAGRIGAASAGGGWAALLRIAAAVAVAAGVGLLAFVLVRGFRGDATPPLVAPEGTLAHGEPVAMPDSESDPAGMGAELANRVTARDLEAALSGALAIRTAARPSATVVLAVDDRRAGGRGDAAADVVDPDAYETLAAVGFDGEPVTFDELSGEFSALLGLSDAPR